jgi:hypothetical protein
MIIILILLARGMLLRGARECHEKSEESESRVAAATKERQR